MATSINCCMGEKTRGIREIDGFRNKLMIPDSEIPKYFFQKMFLLMC